MSLYEHNNFKGSIVLPSLDALKNVAGDPPAVSMFVYLCIIAITVCGSIFLQNI